MPTPAGGFAECSPTNGTSAAQRQLPMAVPAYSSTIVYMKHAASMSWLRDARTSASAPIHQRNPHTSWRAVRLQNARNVPPMKTVRVIHEAWRRKSSWRDVAMASAKKRPCPGGT